MKICGQKKKSITTWLLCAFCMVVLWGCGGISVDTQSDNATDKIEIQDNNTTDKVEIQDENTTDTAEMSDSETIAEIVELTEQELTQWTDYVNSRENNAFLLSYYDEPKQIDLNELFYTGCGLDMEELTEKEVQEYLEWVEMDEMTGEENCEINFFGEMCEDNIFISDEAYMEVRSRLGGEYAQQLRVFAENFEHWIPEEGATAGGTLGLAVYDLDKDGQLELMCALVQGTGLYACNSFYHADVENGQVFELEQEASTTELAFEIENIPSEEWANAYRDDQGRILYMSSDYGRTGMQSAACTEGYYYLENEEVVSVAIRSYMLEYGENEEEIYTYYLSDWDTPVGKEKWEKAGQNFLTDKEALDLSICWKSLYETEIREKKVLGWFLLMAESLDGAV